MEQRGSRLILQYANKKQIESLALTESFDIERRKDMADLSNLKAEADKIISQIKELEKAEGLTPLGRELLMGDKGLEKQKQQLAELKSKLEEVNIKMDEVQLKIKLRKFVFSGEVYIRQ